jgi:large subunit ribosomal protein L21
MKYAIVEDGGKQYKTVIGETIEVDRFSSEIGEELDLERVLLVVDGDNVVVGDPFVAGAKVHARVVSQIKGPKVIVFKYLPKKRFRSKQGHRQQYTRLQIDSIEME